MLGVFVLTLLSVIMLSVVLLRDVILRDIFQCIYAERFYT
jgi:hypothetical protein